jgi:hypothetical protein
MIILQKSGTSYNLKWRLAGHRVPVAETRVALGLQRFLEVDSKLSMSRSFFNQSKSCPACPTHVPAGTRVLERLAETHVPHVPLHVPVNP